MVYGSNIRLSSEFFLFTLYSKIDPEANKILTPRNQKIFAHKDFKTCTHVFVRVDRVKKALVPPYEGPFTVTERSEKYFTLLLKGKPVNISVDRLKPAYLLVTDSIPDKPTIPCKQLDEMSAANDCNLLYDDKPAVTRHDR
ncbi:uncharacterized protein NPIL_320741 [Nephila pilipes]|uniref:Uncharacterized protein n=1 Tax=Nephila pilipes TaxID=299642 RepID=A0A8X6NCG2_NEPPI|nr:uncharacterized protein NPIL_320741 [Nephila pilipes]